jgi:cytochrome c-type biogenesis protein CcsB
VLQGNSYGNNFSSTNLGNTAFYKEDSVETYSNLFVKENNGEKNLRDDRLSFLESLDNLSYRTISFGFPLLTIGIIAGAVWANEAWGSYWSWDPKETWALITWLVFASYLHARITKAWQGRKPAMIASLGFIVVWICYLGVNFLGKGLHTYGQL